MQPKQEEVLCSAATSPGNCGTTGTTVETLLHVDGEDKEGEEGDRVRSEQVGIHSMENLRCFM